MPKPTLRGGAVPSVPRVTVTVLMAMAGCAVSLGGAASASAALGGATSTSAALRAASRPTCNSPTAASEPMPGVPWTTRRYPPDRLATLATGRGVTVAVVDSGVDATSPRLAGRVLPGADFLEPAGDGHRDCTGHGTAVASIIAAAPSAGTALRGLAPEARILPVRVSDLQSVDGRQSGRTAGTAQFAEAIRWSVRHGADVLNLSVVLYADVPVVRKAVAYAVAHDVVVVAAAGNLHEDGDPVPYPAAYPGVIGVGAIDPEGTRSTFSQVGAYVDVVAPGGAVLAADGRGGAGRHDGTSYATPFVSATAALVRQYRPALTAAQVTERIVATADPSPDTDAGYGSGVLDPERAVTERAAGREGAEPRPGDARGFPGTDPDAPADHRTVPETGGAGPNTVPTAPDQTARPDRARRDGLLVAAVSALGVLLSVATAVVWPRGRRRGWAPPGRDTGAVARPSSPPPPSAGRPRSPQNAPPPQPAPPTDRPWSVTGTGRRSASPC